MKNHKLAPLIILLATCLSITIIILVFVPIQRAVVFQPIRPASTLVYLPLGHTSKFKIKYTHSIHLSDVVESYKITEDGQLHQYELMYEDFSIGMPANAGEGESFEQAGGKYYLKNMRVLLPSYYLRIGQVRANHRVIFKDNEYPLSHSIRPGTLVKVEFRSLTFFQAWKGVNILESL